MSIILGGNIIACYPIHMPQPARRVFISHSSADKSLASSIVTYLLSSLTIHDKKEILCTSLPGHELVPGTRPEHGLREALRETQVVLGLLTPNSLERQAVMMELGAAWAFEKHFVPLLFAVEFDRIPDWIQAHAIKLDSSLGDFTLLHERITPVAQLVADQTSFLLKDAAALGGATATLLGSLTTLLPQYQKTPAPAVRQDPQTALRTAVHRKVKALATSLRASENKKATMPFISPGQAETFNALIDEAIQVGVPTTIRTVSTSEGGFGATFGTTATSLSDLIGMLEMLASEFEG